LVKRSSADFAVSGRPASAQPARPQICRHHLAELMAVAARHDDRTISRKRRHPVGERLRLMPCGGRDQAGRRVENFAPPHVENHRRLRGADLGPKLLG
jgi:hypothetical protein